MESLRMKELSVVLRMQSMEAWSPPMKPFLMILPTLTLATNLLATNSGSYPVEVFETHSQPFERGGVLEIDGS